MSVIAVTGGTGFVGGHFLQLARQAGHSIRALTRRPQEEEQGIAWIPGDLGDLAALTKLVSESDVIVHIAGAISAADREGFAEANINGTQNLLDAAAACNVSRFLHISSLAAREPDISHYGWSKSEAESRVRQSAMRWTILRPPAVYGPGDRETLELFKMAGRGWSLLPPGGRMSVIHVQDLARLILICANADESIGELFEPDDGTPNGMTHREFAAALGEALDRSNRAVAAPEFLVKLAAQADRLVRGKNAKLTPDRARYFCHPDWTASERRKPPGDLWKPAIPLHEGLTETAAWYREKGWLR